MSLFSFQDIITCVMGILIMITIMLSVFMNEGLMGIAGPRLRIDEEAIKLAEIERSVAGARARALGVGRSVYGVEWARGGEALAGEITDLERRLVELRVEEECLIGEFEGKRRSEALDDARLGLVVQRAEIAAMERRDREISARLAQVREDFGQRECQLVAARSDLERVRSDRRTWLIPEPSDTEKEAVIVVADGSRMKVQRFTDKIPVVDCAAASVGEMEAVLGAALERMDVKLQYVVLIFSPEGVRAFKSLIAVAKRAGFEVGYDAIESGREVVIGNPPRPPEDLERRAAESGAQDVGPRGNDEGQETARSGEMAGEGEMSGEGRKCEPGTPAKPSVSVGGAQENAVLGDSAVIDVGNGSVGGDGGTRTGPGMVGGGITAPQAAEGRWWLLVLAFGTLVIVGLWVWSAARSD